jgi:hypothetical protein
MNVSTGMDRVRFRSHIVATRNGLRYTMSLQVKLMSQSGSGTPIFAWHSISRASRLLKNSAVTERGQMFIIGHRYPVSAHTELGKVRRLLRETLNYRLESGLLERSVKSAQADMDFVGWTALLRAKVQIAKNTFNLGFEEHQLDLFPS